MLVISRAENESIEIGNDITVTVLEIYEDKVRIGISSPNLFPAYREETLYRQTASAELQLN